ncbi:MAG TPA: ATP-binding protein [Anaerolineales bacterium]|nr:ATP-binding protein [Anaerolineales bacterium]HNB86624.1 ATP-binding protein [Anaerolineales bacterium]HNC90309.1 ATP-binding protein [Anaerolineales bacterium]HND92222.1 ATP-binding protein [Anaerolineales bacterium]HNE68093.1 ATP-binding protein [Anaerolineales bacterium]
MASRASAERSSSSASAPIKNDLPGDPNCPHCHGVGYLRSDVPVGHAEFGKLEICTCRRSKVADNIRDRLFAMSHLDELKDLTFESFKPRGRKGLGEMQARSIEMAFNHAQHYAKSLNGWLLLQGGYGSGKTHLAAAVANFVVGMGVPTLFLTVPDLLDALRFAYGSEDTTFEERFEQIRSAKLLVLDDFGTQNATGWAQEKLFQIINYRYINKLATVVTTNLSLDEIEPRIRSRLSDPELVSPVKMSAPDYRRPMEDTSHPELSSLDLLSSRTFGSFEDRAAEKLTPDEHKSLQKALKIAHSFSEKPKGWLVFEGTYGCGKTHLAAAIANYRAGLGDPPLFVMVPDLLDHLRAAFSPNSGTSYDRRFDEVRTAGLLVLDDLGAQSATPWAREKLHQLLNYRYNAELPTVITVAKENLDQGQIDERIITRMLDERLCEYIEIKAPAYQGKGKRKIGRK